MSFADWKGVKMKIHCYVCGKSIEIKDEEAKTLRLHTGCIINLCKECGNEILKRSKNENT